MKKNKKTLIDYTSKKWNSLGDVRDRIEKDGVEKVIEFNGAKLVTDCRVYGLVFGDLIVKENYDE